MAIKLKTNDYDRLFSIILAAGIFAIALVGTASFFAYRTNVKLVSITQTTDKIDKLGRLLIDMETGIRGFWLSERNPSFITPYKDAKSELKRAKLLPASNWVKVEGRGPAELDRLVTMWIYLHENYLKSDTNITPEDLERGKKEMDAIRSKLLEVRSSYQKSLKQTQTSTGFTFWLILAGLVVVATAFMLLPFFSRKSRKLIRDQQEALVMAAQKSGEEKLTFLNNMSHEIRSPLAVINGYAEMGILSKDAPEAGDSSDIFRQIKYSTNHLSELVNNILDVSKIGSDNFILKNEDVDFGLFIGELFSLTGTLASIGSEYSRVEMSANQNLPVSILTDKLRLKQVLINLLSNALKFSEKNDLVTLKITPRFHEGKGFVNFSVCDLGPGVSDELKSKVFNPFEQGDSSDSRKFEGTGLGLGIAQQIAQKMNSRIKITDNSPKGAIFSIEIECFDPKSSQMKLLSWDNLNASSAAAIQSNSLSDISVLLVDDRKDILRCTASMLEHAGASVTTFSSSKNCIETLKRDRLKFDVGLIDIQMPDLDGYQFVAQAKKILKKTTFVANTASANTVVREKALNSGFFDFVTKPAEPQRIISVIQSAANATFHARTKGAINVLLIDDCSSFKRIFHQLMKFEGLDIDIKELPISPALNIDDCNHLVERHQPKIVIADRNIGDVSFDYLSFLKKLSQTDSVKIIGLSASSEDEIDDEFKQIVNTFCTKSQLESMAKVMKKVVNQLKDGLLLSNTTNALSDHSQTSESHT